MLNPKVHEQCGEEDEACMQCRQEGMLSNAVFWYDIVTALIKSHTLIIYILDVGIPSVHCLYWLMNKKKLPWSDRAELR